MKIGANKDEGLLFESLFAECTELLKKDFKLLIPYHLRRTLNTAEQTAAASILKNIYFWKRDVDFKFASKYLEVNILGIHSEIKIQFCTFLDNW